MDIDQVLQNFQYADLQWLVPIIAGVLVIVGGLLIGLVRGVTAGVIVAIFFGGLLCLSPVLLNALQRQTGAINANTVTLGRDTVALAKLNNKMITDLLRVVTTVRAALEDASPLLDAETVDPAVKTRFTQAMATSTDRLNALSDDVAQGQVLGRQLDAAMQALETEYRRTGAPPQ